MITEIHVDLSNKYHQKGHCLIGYVERFTKSIRFGLIIRPSIIKYLAKRYGSGYINGISNELHSVLIFLLLKDHMIKNAEKIVICCDYNYRRVLYGLEILLNGNRKLLDKFESLVEYRLRLGEPKLKSYADSFVKKAHKHIKKINNIHKRNDIFNNFQFVRLRDIITCLDYVLSGISPIQTVFNELSNEKQQTLNISLLTTYSKTRNP